jgi:hypothetical protein
MSKIASSTKATGGGIYTSTAIFSTCAQNWKWRAIIGVGCGLRLCRVGFSACRWWCGNGSNGGHEWPRPVIRKAIFSSGGGHAQTTLAIRADLLIGGSRCVHESSLLFLGTGEGMKPMPFGCY